VSANTRDGWGDCVRERRFGLHRPMPVGGIVLGGGSVVGGRADCDGGDRMFLGSIVGLTGVKVSPPWADLPPKVMSPSDVETRIAGSQRRIIFHPQRNQAKRIFAVTSAVCHLFLAVEERGFELGVALTVFRVRASNLTPEKELGFAVRTDRPARIFRRSIDDLPNAEVLPIAQAYTKANGTAAAAIAAHSHLTPSGWGHSSDCRSRCVRRRSRSLKATKQKIKRTFGTCTVRHYRAR
jgi:hypothetical protein